MKESITEGTKLGKAAYRISRNNEENKNSHRGSCFNAKADIVMRLQDASFAIYSTAPKTEVKCNLMTF
jgi:hypothetical protein